MFAMNKNYVLLINVNISRLQTELGIKHIFFTFFQSNETERPRRLIISLSYNKLVAF